ncbi:ankyrin repeat domain-containing protein 17-like isoform X2 [Haliotis rufescens]|nr:ankyrin repeat domain-containing protein 17-like isoform X2 [Haliotis rufescens]XP_048246277.1 ankyrin repeat domain-containing protein 17-like isoform X2 [Haliotis rufescens]XP_048246278.1 ankyrin repeat domain-containing protein 17-like isoform X2 [Haliotis rufescens]
MLGRGLMLLLLVVGVLGQECPVGKYGEHCQLNCSRSCFPHSGQDVHCDRHSGKCSEGCVVGWYGDQCHVPCKKNCPRHICSQQTGHCTRPCEGNNTGDFCEIHHENGQKQGASEQSQESASTTLVAILAPVFAILAILIIIIIMAVLFIRHRKSNQASDDVESGELLSPGGVDTDLIVACSEGKLKAVRDILEQSPEVINKKGRSGMTPVMWAARRGHREVLDLLVRKEADLKLVDDASNSILHWAFYGGHVSMVKYVVSKNMVDINSKGRDERTPLMCAAREGKRQIFDLLVSRGGLPSEIDKDGNNILLLACWGGNEEIVKYIISHDDVDIDGRGQSGRTPLMAAAYKGHGKVFDLLVDKEADLTLVDDAGDNVLHVACLGGHVDIVSRVLELGKVDINKQGQCSRTPLMVAARLGHKEIFDLLVTERADALTEDDHRNTILHLACEGGLIDIVEYVLSLGTVNINARNIQNETATMLSTKGGDVCNLLVSHGGLSK